MIGIDITSISRFVSPSRSFLNKILHPAELKIYDELESNQEIFLAARWAIKEALYKSDNKYSNFSAIKIVNHHKKYSYPGYLISTSKEKDTYIAMVIKEKK